MMQIILLSHGLFYITLFADIILILGVIFSVLVPAHRIWPPPSKSSWQYYLSWLFIITASVGVPIVGILDWESSGFTSFLRFIIGGAMIIIAGILSYWGIRTLSLHQSLGLEGKLVTTGPYQHTRNPQYLALIIFYFAVIIIASSYLALLTGILLIIMYAITPFSEEPWLLEQYGEEYEKYCSKVPRFLGVS